MLVFAALTATQAGRPHESGTGALWIAPELVADTKVAQVCSQAASLRARDLVFETLDLEDLDEYPPLLSPAEREVVNFEWNPATGELHFSTVSATGMFADLAPAAQDEAGQVRSCRYW